MNYTDQMGTVGGEYVTLPLCEKRMSLESTGDYTLPDYQPEIRRVLSVTPTVLPPAKYVGGSGVEISGNVDYSVLYVGADGGLYSMPLSSEYHLTVPAEGGAQVDPMGGVTVWSDVVAEGVQARVASPRKISLRCRLRALVRAYGKMLMEERHVGDAPTEKIFRRKGSCENLSAYSGLSDVISLSCDLTGVGDDARVVSAEGIPVVAEVHVSGNETVTASGELLLKLLIARENGDVETLTKNLPFSGEVEIDGVDSEADCRATATMSEMTVEVGEDGRILCSPSLLVEVRGMCNREVSYTEDLFSSAQETLCETETYRIPMAIRCERRNFSQSERIPMSEVSIPEGASICDAWGVVLFECCESVGQKYLLTGESRYTLLCEKDGEYATVELTLPIRYETEGGETEPESASALGRVLTCRARVDGETLCLDAEIAVAADFCGTREIEAVREVRFGEALCERGSRMTVYYPSADEDAWAVAKKYCVAPEKVARGSSYYYF